MYTLQTLTRHSSLPESVSVRTYLPPKCPGPCGMLARYVPLPCLLAWSYGSKCCSRVMTMSTGTTLRAIGGRYARGRFCLKTTSVPDPSDVNLVISDCGVRKR